LMGGIPNEKQARQILQAAEQYLYDPSLKGYRLNTNFGPELPELGRAFGFAYGHKENGAAFSHMSVMFAYALYRQGLVVGGWRILKGLYEQSQDFPKSRMYPGIPEYFNPRGRGMYPYLTGSAAWFIFTLLTESFGVKGQMGDLKLAPKLTADQFSESDTLRVQTIFAGKNLEVAYHNPDGLSYGGYCIGEVFVNGAQCEVPQNAQSFIFRREEMKDWPEESQILVKLVAK